MRFFCTIILLCLFSLAEAQTDTSYSVKVHFLYGSKPLRKYKGIEHKYFGGIHGGHVSIEVDGVDYGFSPKGKFHIIAHKNSRHSTFHGDPGDSTKAHVKGYKVATIIVPLSAAQYRQISQIHSTYCTAPPYDYAFIGMRCAAASQDVLAQIGIVKKRKKAKNVFTTFYPKKLRKRMFRLAEKNHYTVVRQEGRPTRKWERD